MIVTLAGHVDHGKTALVRALTGADTDRLEIEKRRGLTVELGFAYGEFGSRRVGFVDVPGHHKFIRNMIAGVSSEQFALLVVAADEGPMPQTAEHLDILETIGLRRGIVVMTRADLADEERRILSMSATQSLLEGSFLESAEILWCSVRSEEGLDVLKHRIAAAGGSQEPTDVCIRAKDQYFRLCVDRAFNLTGAGLIVTGCVHSGNVQEGDSITSSRIDRSVRVRSIRVSDSEAKTAELGDRAALNLTGLDLEQVVRGDWFLAPEAKQSTNRISLEFQAVKRLPRALHKWTRIHLHHGAQHLTGRLALIDFDRLEAGEACLVDCLLDQPIPAKWGDRVLVRDAASEITLGGGPVIDTRIAERTGRKLAEGRTVLLRALSHLNPIDSLRAALSHKSLISLPDFCSLRNLPERAVLEGLPASGIRCIETGSHTDLVLQSSYQEYESKILAAIDNWHTKNPASQGLSIDFLRSGSQISSTLLRDLVAALVRTRKVIIRSGMLQLPNFRATRSQQELSLMSALQDASSRSPTLGDLSKLLSIEPAEVRKAAKRLEAGGEIVFVNDRRLVASQTLDNSIKLAKALNAPEGFSVGEFRDKSGHGRNACIDILEYLDRRGITRRMGDRRRVNPRMR